MIEIIIFSLISNIMFFSYGNLIKFDYFLNNINNINNRSIIGCILVSFIALFANFFIPLDKTFNSLLLLLGFVFLFLKKKFFTKKELYFILLSSIITSSLIIFSNVNRPDAGLYHLPYISTLNENKIIFGLTNIHFRFGMNSILQYLSAVNYNFLFKEKGIIIPLASIVSFFIIHFFNNVLKIFKNFESTSYQNVFSLFIIIFISYKINRYSSFGNDAVAHLSYFYFISLLLDKDTNNLKLISLISIFIFLNKATMLVVLLVPLILFIKNFSLKNFKLIYSFAGLFLFSWILKNIIVSGCIIYPLPETCFDKLSWTDYAEISQENTSGEAWSKDWPNRNNKEISMDDYIKNFSWFLSWSKNHGLIFTKIVFPYLIFTILIAYLISRRKSSKFFLGMKKNSNYRMLLIVSLIGTILFFIKFPLYRYGYSYLISLFILSIFLIVKNFDKEKLQIYSKILFIICIISFSGKQVMRYIKNFDSPYVWPRIFSYENNEKIKSKEIILNKNFKVYQYDGLCMYSSSPCTTYKLKENIVVRNVLNYKIIELER